jgi:CHAT domain-containing protein
MSVPLLLSGLAFAGANHRSAARPGEENGILTAEEVSALDLSQTRWAVLSACDTGRGLVRQGEGVLGLRRAFQVAGARSLILSLWAVDDEAAREWMRRVYEARWRDGTATYEAVRDATLQVLADRRATGQSVHPFYWAGFIAVGDWR